MTPPLDAEILASRLAALPPEQVITAQDLQTLFGIQEHERAENQTSHLPESFASRLATLPPERLLLTEDLEVIFELQDNEITRAVKRGDLPVPATLFGRNVWTVRAILAHIDALLDAARKEAARDTRQVAAKIQTLYGGD